MIDIGFYYYAFDADPLLADRAVWCQYNGSLAYRRSRFSGPRDEV